MAGSKGGGCRSGGSGREGGRRFRMVLAQMEVKEERAEGQTAAGLVVAGGRVGSASRWC